MKRSLLLLTICLSFLSLNAQIVITEIMYNPPESGNDTTEFIELLNISQADVNLMNYTFTQGIELIFGDVTIGAGEYLVISKDSDAHFAYYGTEAIQWDNGSLSNSGEDIVLENDLGDQVDYVDYDDGGDWPIEADGSGYSLELCDPYKNNADPYNWKISETDAGLVIENLSIFASPGIANGVICEDIVDHTIDVLSLQYDPKYLKINLNETVQWINVSGGNHNVNGGISVYPDNPEGFYSGAPSNDNWVFSHTFTISGVYQYKCDLHGAFGMTGTIEVLPAEANKLVITEIMYNDPSIEDSLEYIEIHNAGDDPINMENFTLESNNIQFTFPSAQVNPGEFFVLCKNSVEFFNRFGFTALSWGDANLRNSGDNIKLMNVDGNIVDEVEFIDVIPWPTLGDGLGHSINLCRPDLDNNIPENWQACPVSTGMHVNGLEIYANPGQASFCKYDVGEITMNNEDGSILYDNLGVEISGTVHGVNMRPGALQFTLIDDFNDGIAMYSGTSNFGYEVSEGDRIIALGKTGQYNGLTQLYLDTVFFFGHQHDLFEPMVVTELNEDSESQMVKLENVTLLDPENWGSGSSGFNVEVSDGTNTYQLRIDNDVNLFTENFPTGTFNVTGIGGQFDNTTPFLDGYQLFPRYIEDIDPFNPFFVPTYGIGTINTENEEGIADSINVTCFIEGIVYGINLNPNGLSFTLIDENNDGINIYSSAPVSDYQVIEGDKLRMKGKIAQYNGLTEFIPDEIELLSSSNPLFDAVDVSLLDESTESQLVKIAFLSLIDESEWKGDGSSFNLNVTNGTNDFVLRIDNDCELSEMDAPQGLFHATGLGGQYDSSQPYTEGYQLFPRFATDLDIAGGIPSQKNRDISIHPNPVRDILFFDTTDDLNNILIIDVSGRIVLSIANFHENAIDLKGLQAGLYTIRFTSGANSFTKTFIKE